MATLSPAFAHVAVTAIRLGATSFIALIVGCVGNDTESKAPALTLEDVVQCVALDPSGRFVAVGGERVVVFDTRLREISWRSAHLTHEILSLAWSPSGHLLAASFRDGPICVWTAGTWDSVANSLDSRSRIAVSWTENGLVAARLGPDSIIIEDWVLSDNYGLSLSSELPLDVQLDAWPLGCRFCNSGSKLATWTSKRVYLAARSGSIFRLIGTVQETNEYIVDAVVHESGNDGIYTTHTGIITSFHIVEKLQIKRLAHADVKLATSLCVSPDGKCAAVAGYRDNRNNSVVRLMRLADGACIASYDMIGVINGVTCGPQSRAIWVLASRNEKGRSGRYDVYELPNCW